MKLLTIIAMVGILINDLVAMLSVLGSTILLFGAFSKAPLKRYGQIANWSITGLTFGLLFQISMTVTGMTPEQIGFMMPMSALMVNALLGVSMLMLGGRWTIRRTLQNV